MKSLNKDEIYTFKLINGEEIVAKVCERFDDHYEIKQPISMVLGPQGLQMMPCLFSSNADKNALLNTASIALAAETREDVRTKYIEATTGLVTPTAKQIITG
jgi:hypothetical protein